MPWDEWLICQVRGMMEHQEIQQIRIRRRSRLREPGKFWRHSTSRARHVKSVSTGPSEHRWVNTDWFTLTIDTPLQRSGTTDLSALEIGQSHVQRRRTYIYIEAYAVTTGPVGWGCGFFLHFRCRSALTRQ